MAKIHNNICPVCGSNQIAFFLKAKDKMVSIESFEVWQCGQCTVCFTQDVPDASEIGKYYQSSEYISHSNTSKGYINKLYHFVKKITLQSKKRLIESNCTNLKGNLLDIGAGTGAFASVMKIAGWHVTGLEPDEIARKNAQKDFNIELLPVENLCHFQPGSFDVITLWHVLEHIHLLHDYLDKIYSLLNDTGVLIIAVPNYTSYDAVKYAENWAAYDVPRHLYHFSPAGMRLLLDQHRFNIIKRNAMWFDSFYVSLLSEKYASGKGSFLKAFINGSISNLKSIGKPQNCSSIIYIAKKII